MSCKSKVTIFWYSTWAEESACFIQFLMLISWWVILNFSFHILLRPLLSKFASVIFYNKCRVIFMNAVLDFCAAWCTCEYYLILGKIKEKLLIFTFPINYTPFFFSIMNFFWNFFAYSSKQNMGFCSSPSPWNKSLNVSICGWSSWTIYLKHTHNLLFTCLNLLVLT